MVNFVHRRDCPRCDAFLDQLAFRRVPYERRYLARCPRCRAVLRMPGRIGPIDLGDEDDYRAAFGPPLGERIADLVAAAGRGLSVVSSSVVRSAKGATVLAWLTRLVSSLRWLRPALRRVYRVLTDETGPSETERRASGVPPKGGCVPIGKVAYGSLHVGGFGRPSRFIAVAPSSSTEDDWTMVRREWKPSADGVVDLDALRREVVALCREHGVALVYFDPWNAAQIAERLRDDGVVMAEWLVATTLPLMGCEVARVRRFAPGGGGGEEKAET